MESENCPDPRSGLDPNHDIFHSKCSHNNFSSSLEKSNKVATARVNCLASYSLDVRNLKMTCLRYLRSTLLGKSDNVPLLAELFNLEPPPPLLAGCDNHDAGSLMESLEAAVQLLDAPPPPPPS